MYDFSVSIDRSGTNSEKWNKKTIASIAGNPDALPFWVADMDLPTSDAIARVMRDIAAFGVVGYPSFTTLEKDFCTFALRRHHWNVEKHKACYIQGLLHGIALSVDLFTQKGDRIVIPVPCYLPFRLITERNERNLVPYAMGYENGGFFLDRARFAESCKGAKAIMFCSPHNPSGLVFSKDDLEFVLRLAKKEDILVLSDEIHADLTHPSFTHYPMGMVNEGIGAKVITFMAPSKTFNIAGEHFGMAVFSDEAMHDAFVARQKALWVHEPGYFIGSMAHAAYIDSFDYNQQLSAYLESNANYISAYLAEHLPMLKFSNGGASFVSFIDCTAILDKVKKDKAAHPELYKGEYLLSQFFGWRAGICVNDGVWFDSAYSGFIRFNYGTSRSMVTKALEAMERAINTLEKTY